MSANEARAELADIIRDEFWFLFDPKVDTEVVVWRIVRAANRIASWQASREVTDAVIVDMLTAFYGEERDGWSMGKVRRMRAALEAFLEVRS